MSPMKTRAAAMLLVLQCAFGFYVPPSPQLLRAGASAPPSLLRAPATKMMPIGVPKVRAALLPGRCTQRKYSPR